MAYVHWLNQGVLPREVVGGKGASLSALCAAGFNVPPGFCIVADGYRHFAHTSGLEQQISDILGAADLTDPTVISDVSERISALVEAAPLPQDMVDEIAQAYDALDVSAALGSAVRSSAISEDGSAMSFAGLYETYLNIVGIENVLASVKKCYVSLWAERAVQYRAHKGVTNEAMAVVVMSLVSSETSGIAFTAHPVTGSRDQVVINSAWGLGEAVVSGRVTPDSFVVDKRTFRLVEKDIYRQELAVYPHPQGAGTIERDLSPEQAVAPSLSDEEACEVGRLAAGVEKHYGEPQDVEFGLSGGKIYLLQARPITTLL
jgi:pyruvate,water dikinase